MPAESILCVNETYRDLYVNCVKVNGILSRRKSGVRFMISTKNIFENILNQ